LGKSAGFAVGLTRYHTHMKHESSPTNKESDFTKHGNAAKPISFHPLKVDAVVAALLKVKPEPKPQK
jgi:hypothetical protein